MTVTCSPLPSYAVGGTVSGLSGALVLQNNGANDLTITNNGSFAFATPVADGASYAVTVETQPSGLACSVANGAGTISGADVTNVTVTCSPSSYTVGGTVSGLSGMLVLQNNGADNLTIKNNGTFSFATPVADGASYAVTVETQPSGLVCSVASGAGTISGADVTNVTVTCSPSSYTVGGTVSGLSGTLVLQNNDMDDLTITNNGTFSFATAVANWSPYAVTVGTQPYGQTCSVANGEGTISGADVTNVTVTCIDLALCSGTKQLGSADEDYATGVAVDSSGNIYVTGYTYGGLDGNINAGLSDLFLVKYDSSCAKQWTRQLGTASHDHANGVAVDNSGNIYVTGYTEGGLDGNTNAGGNDLFLVTYDSTGAKQWTKQLGSASHDYANGVAVDAAGNIYVTGYTSGGLDGNTHAGAADLFLVKYNPSGAKQWTRQLGSEYANSAYGVAVDTSGNIYSSPIQVVEFLNTSLISQN